MNFLYMLQFSPLINRAVRALCVLTANLWSKSINWFLYDNGLRHERVKDIGGPNIHLSIGGLFFPCIDYTVVFNDSNTGIQIILCKHHNISTTTNILQTCSQEDFNSEVYMLLYI